MPVAGLVIIASTYSKAWPSASWRGGGVSSVTAMAAARNCSVGEGSGMVSVLLLPEWSHAFAAVIWPSRRVPCKTQLGARRAGNGCAGCPITVEF